MDCGTSISTTSRDEEWREPETGIEDSGPAGIRPYLEHWPVRIYRHPVQEVVEDEDLLAVVGFEVGLDALTLLPLLGVGESYARS